MYVQHTNKLEEIQYTKTILCNATLFGISIISNFASKNARGMSNHLEKALRSG